MVYLGSKGNNPLVKCHATYPVIHEGHWRGTTRNVAITTVVCPRQDSLTEPVPVQASFVW